jgi:hypothetical protein
MFVLETKGSAAARKMSIVMMLLFVFVLHGLGALLTMHTYVRPKPAREGFRIFGFRLFPRPPASAAER